MFFETWYTRLRCLLRGSRLTVTRLFSKLSPRDSTLPGVAGPLNRDFFENSAYQTQILFTVVNDYWTKIFLKNLVHITQILFTRVQAHWTKLLLKTRSTKFSYPSRGHGPTGPRVYKTRSTRLCSSFRMRRPTGPRFFPNSVDET